MYVYVFSEFVFSCVGSVLETSQSLIHKVLPHVYKQDSKAWKAEGLGQQWSVIPQKKEKKILLKENSRLEILIRNYIVTSGGVRCSK
jgi:hypothetical protein